MTSIKPGSSGGCIDQTEGSKHKSFVFIDDNDSPHRSSNSKNWFSRGRDLLEESRYEDALICFEESQRLGYLKSKDAILLCKRELGLT
jgi:hypothetical protein